MKNIFFKKNLQTGCAKEKFRKRNFIIIQIQG